MSELEAEKKRRVSLTKAQMQTEIGLDLISLCNTYTEDGVLLEDELFDLKNWLERNASSNLPAIEYLSKIITEVIADGKITKEERASVYKALEKILPTELRQDAAEKRKSVEQAEKELLKAEKAEIKAREKEQRENNKSLGSWNFMVAGVRYEGRHKVIKKHVSTGDVIWLTRDVGNRFSRNAVAVYIKNGSMIGFVPEDQASEIAPWLDRGNPYLAYVTKVLTGGKFPIPVVQSYIYGPNSNREGLQFHKRNDKSIGAKSGKKVAVFIFVTLVLIVLLSSLLV